MIVKTSDSIRGVSSIHTGKSSVPRNRSASLDIFLLEKEEERLSRQDRVFMNTHAKIMSRIEAIRIELEKREATRARGREAQQRNTTARVEWKKIKLKY
ncbi:MAG: hypothetical protein WCP58_05700 [bacterium]